MYRHGNYHSAFLLCGCMRTGIDSFLKNIMSLVLLLVQKYQKPGANNAPPRSEKTTQIQRTVALRGEMASYQRPDSRICSRFFIHPGAAPPFARAHAPSPV
jgi:hypothetical protein